MKNFDFLNPDNLGKEYKGFILLKIEDVPDYKCKSVYLRHKRTGLEVFHLIKNDHENLFAFAFRTAAKDSKGIRSEGPGEGGERGKSVGLKSRLLAGAPSLGPPGKIHLAWCPWWLQETHTGSLHCF